MTVLFSIISIWVFTKTLSYGVFELKQHNKAGGILVIILAFFALIFPNIVFWWK